MNTRDARLAALLGLLSPSCPAAPSGKPVRRTARGHWDVLEYSDVVQWVCRCGRSEPITLLPEESARVLLPFDGIHACEVCRKELHESSCKRSCTSLPVNLSGFSLGSICTGRLSIPRLAWSSPKTEVYIKDLRTRTTNAPEGSSTHNSGENRLKQSTVCAPSAVIQSVSTHTTYA